MDLFIAILMCLHLYTTPQRLNEAEFVQQNQEVINRGRIIMDNHLYRETEGGVIIDDGIVQ